MEIENSSEIKFRANRLNGLNGLNRTTLLCGIAGLVLLVLGGMPLLDRAWAHLASLGVAIPGAREVLALVVGAVLVSVAVVSHRRAGGGK